MKDAVRHVFWSFVALAVACFLFITAVQIDVYTKRPLNPPILIRDEVFPGVHHLSGTILVPKTCDELIVHTQQLTKMGYQITFETWENPAVACYPAQVPRDFQAVNFAPSIGVSYTAVLDGKVLPIAVVQTTVQ